MKNSIQTNAGRCREGGRAGSAATPGDNQNRANCVLKILHVTSTSTVSGANRYAFDLAAGQADLGHETIVAMPRAPGDAFAFALKGVRTAPYDSPRALGFWRELRRIRPDVIHCHDGTSARWMRFLPTRALKVVSLHIRYKHSAMSHFDGVHALGEWQLTGTRQFSGRVRKVNNWTPTLASTSDAAAQAARQRAGASDEDFLIGFLGRIEAVKGVDILIEAMKRLPAGHVKLAIVGEGENRTQMETAAAGDDRIRFMGHSAAPSEWYRGVDLLVMPSRHEPFALVALEAMANGAPILASDLEGFQEIFSDRPDCLFAPEDPVALAAAIAARVDKKSGPCIVRDTYEMSRFSREPGVAAVTAFYVDIRPELNS